jgi:hypothetical protein
VVKPIGKLCRDKFLARTRPVAEEPPDDSDPVSGLAIKAIRAPGSLVSASAARNSFDSRKSLAFQPA